MQKTLPLFPGLLLLSVVAASGLLVSPAFAQSSSSGTWNGLSDRFRVDAGYFGLTAQTTLEFNGGNVDFEKDLGVNKNVNTFWVDGTWRVGRRHQLELAFTKTSRDRGDYTLTRDFTWGGQTYNAGLRARGVATSGRVAGRHPGLTDSGTGALIVVNRATVCLIPARSRVSFSTIRRVPQ